MNLEKQLRDENQNRIQKLRLQQFERIKSLQLQRLNLLRQQEVQNRRQQFREERVLQKAIDKKVKQIDKKLSQGKNLSKKDLEGLEKLNRRYQKISHNKDKRKQNARTVSAVRDLKQKQQERGVER